MPTAQLTDRAILAVNGKDAFDFLQSIVTQDLNLLESQPAVYAALLTSRGKFLFDFFILKHENNYWIDCHKNELMHLARAFYKYKLNNQIDFEDLSEDYNIYAMWENEPNAQTTHSYPDPRHKMLGQRIIAPVDSPFTADANMADYTNLRITHTIPDGVYDGFKEKSLPSDLNLDLLHAVSFEKGCYVGQEVTSRLHHKTGPKKRLFTITFDGEKPTPGTALKRGPMEAGHVFTTSSKNEGLAIIKLREIDKGSITLNGYEVSIRQPVKAGNTGK